MSPAPSHRRDTRAPRGRHAARPAPSPRTGQLGAASAVTALALGGAAALGGAGTALPAVAVGTPAPVTVHLDTGLAVPATVAPAVTAPVAPKATTVAPPAEKRTAQTSRRTGNRAGAARPTTDSLAVRTGGRHAARQASGQASRQAAGQGARTTATPELLPGCPSPDVTADLANGRIPDSDLCVVPGTGQRLRSDAAAAWVALAAAYAKEFGHDPRITDSYRSLEVQEELAVRKPTLAAKPGTSNHGLGIAVDLADGIERVGTAQHTWMLTNAGRFGWSNPAWARPGGSKLEPWHWEYAAPLG